MVTQYFFFLAWKLGDPFVREPLLITPPKKKCSFTEELSPLILAQIFEDM